jgi:hypothetical protein
MALSIKAICIDTGEQPDADDAYQHFLELWKNADADIPLLMQAKAGYAKGN